MNLVTYSLARSYSCSPGDPRTMQPPQLCDPGERVTFNGRSDDQSPIFLVVVLPDDQIQFYHCCLTDLFLVILLLSCWYCADDIALIMLLSFRNCAADHIVVVLQASSLAASLLSSFFLLLLSSVSLLTSAAKEDKLDLTLFQKEIQNNGCLLLAMVVSAVNLVLALLRYLFSTWFFNQVVFVHIFWSGSLRQLFSQRQPSRYNERETGTALTILVGFPFLSTNLVVRICRFLFISYIPRAWPTLSAASPSSCPSTPSPPSSSTSSPTLASRLLPSLLGLAEDTKQITVRIFVIL